MRDRLFHAVRADRHLADRQPLAELEQTGLGDQVARVGLRRKLMLRLVVTASGSGPIDASTPTYMAKSASAIMVGPEIVPPGRKVPEGPPHADAAVRDLLDGEPAAG